MRESCCWRGPNVHHCERKRAARMPNRRKRKRCDPSSQGHIVEFDHFSMVRKGSASFPYEDYLIKAAFLAPGKLHRVLSTLRSPLPVTVRIQSMHVENDLKEISERHRKTVETAFHQPSQISWYAAPRIYLSQHTPRSNHLVGNAVA